MILFILLEYIILAIMCYFLYWKIDLSFYKNNEQIEINDKDKRNLFIIMSILWIIYIPKLLISYLKGDD